MDANYSMGNYDQMSVAVNWWFIKSTGKANLVCTENGPGGMEEHLN